jgi:hypothetical protein
VAGEDSIWAAGDWLFVVSLQKQIAAIHRVDGRVAWVTELPRRVDPDDADSDLIAAWYGPLLVSDRLVVTGTNGMALAVSPYTGAILGQQELAGPASLAPIVAGGTIYVVTDDGKLVALR